MNIIFFYSEIKNIGFHNNKGIIKYTHIMTVWPPVWYSGLTAIQEVPGSIPGYTPEIFLEV